MPVLRIRARRAKVKRLYYRGRLCESTFPRRASPTCERGADTGGVQLAIDAVGAGHGELVLLVLEGRAARAALGQPSAPVDSAIVGIVDPRDGLTSDN